MVKPTGIVIKDMEKVIWPKERHGEFNKLVQTIDSETNRLGKLACSTVFL